MTVILNLPRIHFDFGAVSVLGAELTALGVKKPLIVTDHGLVKHGVLDRALGGLPKNHGFPVFAETPENPTVEGVEKALAVYRRESCDGLVAIGGGSVIDTTKAVSVLAGHPGDISLYYRNPKLITAACAPIVSIPTTAGTGSEVTFGAGIHPDAASPSMNIGSPFMIPKVAICDPELTLTLPPILTAGTGMDAMSQCIEGFLAPAVNPLIEAIVLDGMRRAVKYIERAVKDGSDREARWNMMMAGLEGGIGIHKGLGAVHAVGLALSDRGYHHGILVTVVMPSVLRFLKGHIPEKIKALNAPLGLDEAGDAAVFIEQLNRKIGLPTTLKELGYLPDNLDAAADFCVASKFNLTSPVVPSKEEYKGIILGAMG